MVLGAIQAQHEFLSWMRRLTMAGRLFNLIRFAIKKKTLRYVAPHRQPSRLGIVLEAGPQ